MPIQAVLFDFDGTLVDSFAAITASTNHVRHSYELPALPEATVRQYVGLGLANLMETLVPNAPSADAIARYREHHQTVMLTQTRLLPGVAEVVPKLARRGIRMGVCSNKRVEFTRQLVEGLGLTHYFPTILGPEDVQNRPKPEPDMLWEGLKRLGATTQQAVYVGDMAVDVHAARAAGIPVWLVLGGASGHESATAAAPDRVLSQFQELLELIPAESLL